jgi:site-specific recombinase XerD
MFAEGLSIPRVEKHLRLLCSIDKKLNGKDFKTLEKKDFIGFLNELERTDYSDWTKCDYRVSIKKYYRWLNNGKLPESVEWIKSVVKNQKRLMPQEILTTDEVLSLINHATNIRDKALISCLYESGCRVGELMTLKLKQVTFDKYGAVFMVNGKTGVRRVRIISSNNLIGQWLNVHRGRNNCESYLWGRIAKPNEMLSYQMFIKLIRIIAKRAGVNKRVNPHSFRHARATHMANKLTEAQMKMYFGWTQSSKMASVYVHLSGRDVDSAVLKYYGIQELEEVHDALRPITCSCGEINTPVNNYCNKCGLPLRTEVALGVDDKKKEIQDFLVKMMQDPDTFEKIKAMVQAK